MLPSTCCPLDLSFSCCPSLHPFLRILSLVVPSISMANEEMNISMNKKLLVLWILVSLQQEQQWWHNFYTKHTRIPVQDRYVIENACFAIHKRYIIWPRGVRFWCTPQIHNVVVCSTKCDWNYWCQMIQTYIGTADIGLTHFRVQVLGVSNC